MLTHKMEVTICSSDHYIDSNTQHMPVGHKPYDYDAHEEPIFRCASEVMYNITLLTHCIYSTI